MRQTNPLIGVGLVVLGIAVAAVIVFASGVVDRGADGDPVTKDAILAAATLSPRASHFADSVDARVDIAVDTRRVDVASVVVQARFDPYSEVDAPRITRRTVGKVERLSWGVTLRCFEADCRPLRQLERVTFAPLHVRFEVDSEDGPVARSWLSSGRRSSSRRASTRPRSAPWPAEPTSVAG